MKVKHQGTMQGAEKEFLDLFQKLCYSRSGWEVWSDLMSVMACSISNAVDIIPEHHEAREREYEACIKRLGSVEIPAQMLGIIVMALENNPDQDFLGKMYMNLNLGNHWKGQFFTPYCVSKAMAEMTLGGIDKQIQEQGYISVCDPTCGAGGMLLAAANTCKKQREDYQSHILFIGQDIDRVVGLMCYIQLSLMGCAGYVCIGNTITHPLTGGALFPREGECQELWYTPIFYSQVWTYRRMFHAMGMMTDATATSKKAVEKEHFYIFFDFDNKEVNYGD